MVADDVVKHNTISIIYFPARNDIFGTLYRYFSEPHSGAFVCIGESNRGPFEVVQKANDIRLTNAGGGRWWRARN